VRDSEGACSPPDRASACKLCSRDHPRPDGRRLPSAPRRDRLLKRRKPRRTTGARGVPSLRSNGGIAAANSSSRSGRRTVGDTLDRMIDAVERRADRSARS
jgi:hypothetical protein